MSLVRSTYITRYNDDCIQGDRLAV